MIKYYTRACNFYYGSTSKEKIKKKLALPLNGSNLISFDSIEIITRKNKKKTGHYWVLGLIIIQIIQILGLTYKTTKIGVHAMLCI